MLLAPCAGDGITETRFVCRKGVNPLPPPPLVRVVAGESASREFPKNHFCLFFPA